MATKNFVIRNGLTIGTLAIIDSDGNITANVISGTISASQFTGTLTLEGAVVSGNLVVNGTTSFGNVEVSGDIIPTANITYNLGSPTRAFNELYLAGSTITLGGVQLKQDGVGSISVVDPTSPSANVKISASTGIEVNGVRIANSSGQLDSNQVGKGYINSTVYFFPTGDLSGGDSLQDAIETTDAFGVSQSEQALYTLMEPNGRIESNDLGGLT